MSGIHQFVPMLHRHDAVGEHTRALRDLLVAAGVDARIYCERPDPATAAETRPYLEYAAESDPDDVLVYQFATASAMAGWLADREETLVVNYHSVTPAPFFGPWNNAIALLQVAAGRELARLAPRADLGIAVSTFDAGELRAAGCRRVEVIPVVNVAVPPVEPDPAEVDGLRAVSGGGARWLSVGRLAPNKEHQRVIAALFVARAEGDPRARLTIVGGPTEPNYAGALTRYAAALGLGDAVDFVSGISDERLAAHYRAADVLVFLSAHEGFGVPLVEAMGHGLPVVALDEGAVAEVLDGAGVLLTTSGPRAVASTVGALLADPAERARLADAGRSRFGALGLADAGKLLVDALCNVRVACRATAGDAASRRTRGQVGFPAWTPAVCRSRTPPFPKVPPHRRA